MYAEIDIGSFLTKSREILVLDARTPDEFDKGHIPGSINFPLFTNEERKIIGTIYKQKGRDPAVIRGLELTGPKLSGMVSRAQKIALSNQLLVHCWRGGFRSTSLAWLFDTAGIRSYILKGGYKSYRKHVLDELAKPLKVLILGGMTGSGKTEVLKMLEQKGQQIIDLEALAHHKGSAFGALGESPQPTNEQFENNLFSEVDKLDRREIIWIEDESRHIGKNMIPLELFNMMRNAFLICLDVDLSVRKQRLVNEYARFPDGDLEKCIFKISKRLGGLNTQRAIEALSLNNYQIIAEITLWYYDKTYNYNLQMRDGNKIIHLKSDLSDLNITADKLIELSRLKNFCY